MESMIIGIRRKVKEKERRIVTKKEGLIVKLRRGRQTEEEKMEGSESVYKGKYGGNVADVRGMGGEKGRVH